MMNTNYREAVTVSSIVLCIVFSVCQVMAGSFVPGQVVVRFKNDVSIEKSDQGVRFNLPGIDALNQEYKLEACERIFRSNELKNIYLLDFEGVADAEMIALQYSALPEVEYASANYIARIGAVYPDDTDFGEQWGLDNTGQTGGTPDADIDAPEAWDTETGESSVIIAILDTGIDLDHPDLSGKLVAGWDFVNGDSDPQDDSGHGTHVAGIAGASTNNTQGIAGVCWGCALMPVKVLNASGTGTYSQISQGVEYAADHGAKVINLSLGSETESPLLQTAVDYAHTQGCVVVGAAGNFNSSNPFYPAACTNAVAVAGLDHNDVKYQLSGYGDWIDLCAPGVNIRSTVYNDTYATWSGTSMAAPLVSGVAGLLFSANPTWSNNLVEAQMKRMADAVDGANPSHAGLLGQGRVNANASVITAVSPDITYLSFTITDPSPGDADGELDPDETADLTVTLHNAWGDATGVTGVLSTSDPYVIINDATGAWGTIGSLQNSTNTADILNVTLSDSCPAGHVVSFSLDLQDSLSNTWNLTFELITGSREYVLPSLILVDTTLSNNETYLANSNVIVDSGAILEIEPGVVIKIKEECSLSIRNGSRIIANGSEHERIIFMSQNPTLNWNGLYFANDPSGNIHVINYCDFQDWHDPPLFNKGASVFGEIQFTNNRVFGTGNLGEININSFEYNSLSSIFNGIELHIYIQDGSSTLPMVNSNHIAGTIKLSVHDSSSSFDEVFVRNNYGEGTLRASSGGSFGVVFENNNVSRIEGYNHNFYPCSDTFRASWNNARQIKYIGEVDHNIVEIGFSSGGIVGCLNVHNNTVYGGAIGIEGYDSGSICENNNLIDISDSGIKAKNQNDCWRNNNFLRNETYSIRNQTVDNVDATYCYWDTAATQEMYNENTWPVASSDIATIFDIFDNALVGFVDYGYWRDFPNQNAPGYLWQVTLNPPSPVGAELVTFTLTFSRPMNSAIEPIVTFGLTDPYETHQITGSWQPGDQTWVGTFAMDNFTGDGLNTLKVKTAEDLEGMIIPIDTTHTFTLETGIGGVQGVAAVSVESGIDISWQQNYEPDLLGYMLYYDTDSGVPYEGTGATQGDSPIDVGNVTTFRLTNLTPDQTYYFSIRAYDFSYNLSPYSSEVWAIVQEPTTPEPTSTPVTPEPTSTPGTPDTPQPTITPSLPVPAMDPGGTVLLVIVLTMLIFLAPRRR